MVQHIITTVDCQPSGENGVLVFVVGQLKVLNSYVCTAPVVFREFYGFRNMICRSVSTNSYQDSSRSQENLESHEI